MKQTLFFAWLVLVLIHPALQTVAILGEVEIRLSDVLYLLFVLTCLLGKRPMSIRQVENKRRNDLFLSLCSFLFIAGASIFAGYLQGTNPPFSSAVSYAKLLQDASMAFLLPLFFNIDFLFLSKTIRLIGWICFFQVAVAVYEYWGGLSVFFSDERMYRLRPEAAIGYNVLGLVSGITIIATIAVQKFRKTNGKDLSAHFPSRVFLVVGLVGLTVSGSIGSIVSTLLTVLYLMYFFSKKKISLRMVFVGSLVSVFAFGVIILLRFEDVIGVLKLEPSSQSARLLYAYLGLSIFLSHPFLGVGWQNSSFQMVGSFFVDDAINVFDKLPTAYFPLTQVTSVHNAYLGLLADIGIVGFILFAIVIYRTFKCLPSDVADKLLLRTIVKALLILILIWINSDYLYPGNTDFRLLWIFIGIAAGLAPMKKLVTIQRRVG